MATLTNQATNTASVTNQAQGSNDLTWDEATFTWNSAAGTFDNPYSISNQAANTATITNQAAN